MGNNKKMQMTPIAEAISLIEDFTAIYCTNEGSSFQYLTPEGVKEMLESLLEKEKQLIIDAQQSKPWSMRPDKYRPGFYTSQDISGEQYYDDNFKPYEP